MHKLFTYVAAPFFVFLIFFWSGCLKIPANPVMPEWNVNLNIPIINRNYTLDDIIKKQNYISEQDTNSKNNIFLIRSDNYSQSVGISEFIKATGTKAIHDTIPTSTINKTLYIQFPDNAIITKAVFSSGVLSYKFSNPSNQTVTLNLTIPGITISGNEFSEQVQLNPFSTDSNYFDFSGATYNEPTNQPTIFDNSLQVIVSPTATQPTKVNANLYTTNFFFNYATGTLKSKSLGTKSESFALNISSAKNYRNKINLKNANLNLDASYESPADNPFPIEVQNLTIVGKRNDGSQFFLSIPDSAKTFIFDNGIKHFDFDASNSNITNFISFLPDSIDVTAEYIMNPNNSTGTVTSQDSVRFETNFSTTSYLAINNASITDTSNIGNFSDQDRTKIKASKSAYLSVDVQNGIPLQTSLTVNITDSTYKTLFTLKNSTNNSNKFSILPASVDASGKVTASKSTSFTIRLDSTLTDELSHGYYAIYTISAKTPDSPTPVALRPKDPIKIHVYGGVDFEVSNDNLK